MNGIRSDDPILYAMMKCPECDMVYAIKTVTANKKVSPLEKNKKEYYPRDFEVSLIPVATSGKIVCPYCGTQTFK